MKKLIALFCVASAVTALADTPAASDNVFGVLRVDSTSAQTIVSIPWEAPGGGAIKVKDAIKTANLTKGDQLYYYDATATTPSYKLWVLDDNGWEGAETVKGGDDGKGIVTASRGGDEELARGGALILVRQNPTKEDGAANPFYLYGQYTSSAAEVNLATPSDIGKVAFSLVAPPKLEGDTIDLNAVTVTWTGMETTDHIILPSGKLLNWDSSTSTWGERVIPLGTYGDGEWVTTGAKVALGQGVWFKSEKGTVAKKSVRWGN